jgi:hypothetical protein
MVSGNLCRIASQELKEYLGFDIIIKNDNKNVKNRQNQSSWLPLFVALVERLTEKQKTDVIQYDRKKKPFVFYTDVCDCFEDSLLCNEVNYNPATSSKQCICGVNIENEFIIVNKETEESHVIGSTCVGHWNPILAEKIEQDKKRKLDPEATFCRLCGRKNNKKNCSCHKKDILNLCFNELKSNASTMGKLERINWGKYKEAQLSYFEMLVSENPILVKYVRYIIDNQDNSQMKLENLTKLIEYKKRVDSQDHLVNEDFEERIQKKINTIWVNFTLKYQTKCCCCHSTLTAESVVKWKINPISKKRMFKCLTC